MILATILIVGIFEYWMIINLKTYLYGNSQTV
nr:MAG TPA: hypothetical protein [Caudoviricetes sp.]